MNFRDGQVLISASDLSRHLACRHLTSLDLLAAKGAIPRVYRNDPSLDALIERGYRHEAAYLDHLKEKGLQVVTEQDGLDDIARLRRTSDAMKDGVDVIARPI
jgi:uncharacterized protein